MGNRTGRDTGGAAPPRVRRALATLLAGVAAASILGATLGHTPVARAAEPGQTWVPELAVENGDDTNVVAVAGAIRLADGVVRAQSARSTRNEGELLLSPRRLDAPVDRVTATVTADVPPGGEVLVDVRGIRGDGTWSQWSTASPGGPARLPEATTDLQVRVTLVAGDFGASPALQRLWFAADKVGAAPAPTPTTPAPTTTTPAPTTTPSTTTPAPTTAPTTTPAPAKAAPVTSRVFATRIGLVGNTTANGHVIVPRDHFVALPSRRGLSPRDKGDYTVKVCAPNGRCAWSPVWDVGPWNIKDDYWNVGRQQWGDLALGLPQAQAAFQGGYNGGKDGFGRRVANPAGIDLADGTYYDDLQLRDNSWVTVTYLWTGTGPSALARPTGAPTLVVRSAPTDASSSVGAVAAGARMAVTCVATGQPRVGSQGASSQWLQVGPQQYVPAAAVEAPRVAPC